MYTPLKINMEPKNGGLKDDVFLFIWVIFKSYVKFQGCSWKSIWLTVPTYCFTWTFYSFTFSRSEKYALQIGSFPQFSGWTQKHIWNQQLESEKATSNGGLISDESHSIRKKWPQKKDYCNH